MTDIEELREKHKQEIEKLQNICIHLTHHWALECWAPGHFTGRELKICDNCGKMLEGKR